MMLIFYRFGILIYGLAIRLVSLWSDKAKLWVQGRSDTDYTGMFADLPRRRIWMHCASLGEYEMGKPVLEGLMAKDPELGAIISFFSPSGYEHVKSVPGKTKVVYLPLDSPSRSKAFAEAVSPEIALLVKYEFWYYTIKAMQASDARTYLISAVIRPNHPMIKWGGAKFRALLSGFDQIFTQDEGSALQLRGINLSNVTVTGDTRYDRVLALSQNAKRYPEIEQFIDGAPVLLLGSSWQPEEELVSKWYQAHQLSGAKLIIAPHDIQQRHLQSIESLFPTAIRYSNLAAGKDSDVLIIDAIGHLSVLYRYATVAFVGGAFGPGLHNILEPAAHGVPVLFGPEHGKYPEAKEMMEYGVAFEVADLYELKQQLDQLLGGIDPKLQSIQQHFVARRSGSSDQVIEYIGR